MPTPDRYPGQREEGEGLFLKPEASPGLSENGEISYQTSVGFRFMEEGIEKGLTGTGITEPQHEAIDSLVHNLSETHYEEVTRSGGHVTNITQWTDTEKTTKVRETVIDRIGGLVSQVDVIQYDSGGFENQRMTGVVTRSSGRVSSIAWTEMIS